MRCQLCLADSGTTVLERERLGLLRCCSDCLRLLEYWRALDDVERRRVTYHAGRVRQASLTRHLAASAREQQRMRPAEEAE